MDRRSWLRNQRSQESYTMRAKWSDAHHQIRVLLTAAVLLFEVLQRTDRNSIIFSVVLDVIELAITADWLCFVTHSLEGQFPENALISDIHSLLSSSTELAVAVRLSQTKQVPALDVFLLGSACTKLLLVGGLATLVYGVRHKDSLHDARTHVEARTVRLLGWSGALVMALAMGTEKTSISQCGLVLLSLFVLYVERVLKADGCRAKGKLLPSRYDFYFLVPFLITKAVSIHLAHRILGHVQELQLYPNTSIYFTLLPMATVLVDQVGTLPLNAAGIWTGLISSVFINYFLFRLLVVVATGSEIGVAHGQKALGVCLMMAAMCLYVSKASWVVRSLVLLVAYASMSVMCVLLPNTFDNSVA